jgi:hypothetical protein
MTRRASDYGLEFLLGFDGRIHHLEKGYWLKFEIARVTATMDRPHGLSYSFTLHAPGGTRLVGFDNAHDVPARGSRFKRRDKSTDHWHRTEKDPGRPYEFKDAETLIDDFSTRSSGSCATVELAYGSRKRKHHGGRNETRQGSEPAIAARRDEGRGPRRAIRAG